MKQIMIQTMSVYYSNAVFISGFIAFNDEYNFHKTAVKYRERKLDVISIPDDWPYKIYIHDLFSSVLPRIRFTYSKERLF